MRYFAYLLVLIHTFLLAWAIGGFIEFSGLSFPWPAYTNADFPNWLLPIHWGSVILAVGGFLIGYFLRWKRTASYMLAAYTMLFTLCVIETFGFMKSETRFMAMTLELISYLLILGLLFRNSYFKRYFKQD